MPHQVPLHSNDRAYDAQFDARRGDRTHELCPDLAYRRLGLVNVVFYGLAGASDREWVLIDAGVMGTKALIVQAAEERFGPGSRPAAIVLTHGHFDHVGSLEALAAEWDVGVYAHGLEHPYLDGSASYPPPDPTVGGGLMSMLAPLYPRGPVDVRSRLKALPLDGTVPQMPGWRWLHTPGHTPGHISLWREADRTMIAGDAFITTRQESAYAVLLQQPEMHGPPMYYTTDWAAARASVALLAALEPERVVTGHGAAMKGESMRAALNRLAREFDSIAVPEGGRYVRQPANQREGGEYRRPDK
ncbi:MULTISPECIES: MBL fold metallo-hydrolase [unclassified Chelatococcus]|uniref:MBL fold metallo-hydrolase n=1 Tax=unclassified Chelatococcus TaxID=2638111 RepID=UPI001BCB4845|nr:MULTISPECIES: MBL fold metallo-hydrolase [unclassified Chelatococcus]MBS7700067.1 MBL fold metallo-hydrolase [Chelatococcus sp. YT9]MBX3556760.1 MBL fold metallo-hydrolase [Chelatococcus sp.]